MPEIETCCECGSPTGRAGIHDDSLYATSDFGPYCEECWSDVPEKLAEEVVRLRMALEIASDADAAGDSQDGTDSLISSAKEADARSRCYSHCRNGEFLDFKNVYAGVCRSAAECEGWRAYIDAGAVK